MRKSALLLTVLLAGSVSAPFAHAAGAAGAPGNKDGTAGRGGVAKPAAPTEAPSAPRGPLPRPQGGAPVVDPRDDRVQRRAIRGHGVDFARESPELRELREFEQATFPRGGLRDGNGEDGEGRDDLRAGGVLGAPRRDDDGVENPGETPPALRTPSSAVRAGPPAPPLPWLASLRLLDNLGLSATFVRFEAHVLKYLEFYKDEKRGRSIMASWLRNQGRYRALIEEVLDRHQLPRFLLYVAMIESGYDPHDRSTAGAVGLWQFMAEGARIYGLRVDYWVDQRKDPVLSTEAVARYLGDLKARFGSWHLALAGFNAGYGAVLRAMQKYNTNDYWELCRHEDGLPWETLLYVPKAIATALVGENRGLFGYEDVVPEAAFAFDEVRVASSVTLAMAARAVGAQEADLAKLNPELRRGRTPPLQAGQTWTLRLPKGTAARFADSYDPHAEKLENYVVRFGERLEDIAQARGISPRELRRLNGVEESVEIRAGLTLLVPQRAKVAAASAPSPGEEVVLVAVPDKDLVVPGRKRVFYRVISGDTISGIARFFHVTQGELARWNNLDLDATLATRMVLVVWIEPGFDTGSVALLDPARVRVVTTGSEEFFELVEILRGRKRVVYLCKDGDTLQKIGKRYGLTAADLERINRLGKSSELRAGQSLIVYVAMSDHEKAEARRKLVPGGGSAVTVTDIHDGNVDDDGVEADPKKDAPDGKPEMKPEAKTDAKPERKAEVRPEGKAEAKTDAKPEVKTDAKADARAGTKEDRPRAKTEPKKATETPPKPDAPTPKKAAAEPDAKPDAKPDVRRDAKNAETAAPKKSVDSAQQGGAPSSKEPTKDKRPRKDAELGGERRGEAPAPRGAVPDSATAARDDSSPLPPRLLPRPPL